MSILEDIVPLEEELPTIYKIKCLNDGIVTMNEAILKTSPYLAAILNMDSTIETIEIPIHACHSKTLELVY
jgi:hypothetical protein